MKRASIVSLGILAIAIGVALFFVFRSNGGAKTTDTLSSTLADDNAKVAFLKQYLKMYSPVEAAEFHIRYQDNSGGAMPAPSDYDMQVVMKMTPQNVLLWTAGLKPTQEALDFSWAQKLTANHGRWAVTSKPVNYKNGQAIVAVFSDEGIIYKRVSTN